MGGREAFPKLGGKGYNRAKATNNYLKDKEIQFVSAAIKVI